MGYGTENDRAEAGRQQTFTSPSFNATRDHKNFGGEKVGAFALGPSWKTPDGLCVFNPAMWLPCIHLPASSCRHTICLLMMMSNLCLAQQTMTLKQEAFDPRSTGHKLVKDQYEQEL
jgi:hypothetical protein